MRSFRFQWPSDLLTSLAFEMETLILGWYILVETRSVLLLGVFGALQYLGTLIAPLLGVIGDRVGRRTLLCVMRAVYAALAMLILFFGLSGTLTPVLALVIAAVCGLVRPSDLGMRQALIGDTMPARLLMNAMGLSRTTTDIARIAGALAGASLFAHLGIGYSYLFVTCFYLASLGLTLGVAKRSSGGLPVHAAMPEGAGPAASPAASFSSGWRELKDGMVLVWNTPRVLAMMWLAFLINLTAFPLTSGFLPFVARNLYRIDEIGLSHLVAAFAVGALVGSVVMTLTGGARNATRFMVVNVLLWYVSVMSFTLVGSKAAGMLVLLVIGLFQSTSMITMAVALVSSVGEQFRARVMGVRMLAIYGMPLGLLAGGALIESVGFIATIATYCATGVLGTAWIGYRWRRHLWH